MKKTIIIITMLFNLNVFADEAFSQLLKCEATAVSKDSIKNANPQICIDAASLYKEKKNLTTDERKYYGEAYYNAGIMYTFGKGNKNYNKAYEMFLNAYKVGYGKKYSDVMHKLGYFTRYGEGTEKNKILAYKYYLEAAKMGNENSQNALDSLCKESPWACK